jgi:hypothetical protein
MAYLCGEGIEDAEQQLNGTKGVNGRVNKRCSKEGG